MTPRVWINGAGMNGEVPPLEAAAHPLPDVAMVEDMAQAIVRDMPERADVIGHSLGGMVAMVIAATWPGRVRRLVIYESTYGVRTRIMDRIGTRVALFIARVLSPRRIAALTSIGQKPETVAAFRPLLEAAPHRQTMRQLRAAARFDGRPLLPRIAAPTLVLTGKQNSRTHAQARYMERHIPEARAQMLPGGHFAHLDDPVAFAAAVEGFLEAA
ncbi:alpha/beta fold hydrolase [Pontivivens ytuae]|uniref:Alpha/beta hydrolase n=1 Tax=Pontivivens ytuae TaxID=2789856 RepID=A0A7S9QB77_9RHOB|nr:alpha/beta hydrolase [Pontivivens ytuae]QPH52583.1 alpha/beta hydrolase [Pontivivens ytuae]